MTGFWERLKVSIEAKLNKLMERFEDPIEQLDYAYAKMVQQLHNVNMALARAVTARKRLEFEVEEIEEKIARLDKNAKEAMKIGREDLARKALERKHVLLLQKERIEEKIEEMKKEEEDLKKVRDDLESKVEMFRARKEQLKAEYESAKAQAEVKEMLTGFGDEVVNVARIVDRADSKIKELEARSAAIDELIAVGGTLDVLEPEERDEIERELERARIESSIEEELKKLKEEVSGG
ncbi:MAG TPA: PspA/IM30 family protein [Candidatus Korarchaeota archaeon]|nr:PspA/IM30 family protein [Candidatus Korarchaeota archaeon]